jgi:hypothetical protein
VSGIDESRVGVALVCHNSKTEIAFQCVSTG